MPRADARAGRDLDGEEQGRKLVERSGVLERGPRRDRHEDVDRVMLGEADGLAVLRTPQCSTRKILTNRPLARLQERLKERLITVEEVAVDLDQLQVAICNQRIAPVDDPDKRAAFDEHMIGRQVAVNLTARHAANLITRSPEQPTLNAVLVAMATPVDHVLRVTGG